MSEQAQWSEDVCTCGHVASAHADRGAGRCRECDDVASYATDKTRAPLCLRYQWNGEDRRRTW